VRQSRAAASCLQCGTPRRCWQLLLMLHAVLCSVLLLRSCQGFEPVAVWCCSKNECPETYQATEVRNNGFPPWEQLDWISCRQLPTAARSELPLDELTRSGRGLIASLAAVTAVTTTAALLLFGLEMFRQHQRCRSRSTARTLSQPLKSPELTQSQVRAAGPLRPCSCHINQHPCHPCGYRGIASR
jgi:hypothetical protein